MKISRQIAFGLALGASLIGVNATAKPELNGIAPDFTLPSNGQYNLRLSEQKGFVVVAFFWTTWCGNCAQVMAELAPLDARFKAFGTKFWAINLDKPESMTKVVDQYSSLNLDFPILFDSAYRVSKRYDIGELPTILVIDRDGILKFQKDGIEPQDIATLEQLLQKLVSE